jgi:hypothetical protein
MGGNTPKGIDKFAASSNAPIHLAVVESRFSSANVSVSLQPMRLQSACELLGWEKRKETMATFWVRYNFSEFNWNGTSPGGQDLSFLGQDLTSFASPVSGPDALPTPAESQQAEIKNTTLINETMNSNPGDVYSQYVSSSIDSSSAYLVGSKTDPKTLTGPAVSVAPVSYDNQTLPGWTYNKWAWEKVTLPNDLFSLNFSFSQGEDASGRIQPGTLTATLADWATGQTAWTETAQVSGTLPLNGASCDDAFPLQSATDREVTSLLPSRPSWHCLTWNLQNFQAASAQVGVIMHPGNSPISGQVSGNSESCLVVSETHFLDPLDGALENLAGLPVTTPGKFDPSLGALNKWLNGSTDGIPNFDPPTMATNVTVTQSLLDLVETPDGGGFQFQMTRPLEKSVMAIYAETDLSNGDETVREALLPSTSTGAQTSTVFDPAQDLDTSVTTQPADHNILTLMKNTPYLKPYISDLDKAYSSVNLSDQFAITLLGYEVQYGGAGSRIWYFDGKGNPSFTNPNYNLTSEYLMYDNAHRSITI